MLGDVRSNQKHLWGSQNGEPLLETNEVSQNRRPVFGWFCQGKQKDTTYLERSPILRNTQEKRSPKTARVSCWFPFRYQSKGGSVIMIYFDVWSLPKLLYFWGQTQYDAECEHLVKLLLWFAPDVGQGVCVCVYTYICWGTHTHTHIPTHIHTYIYIYTHYLSTYDLRVGKQSGLVFFAHLGSASPLGLCVSQYYDQTSGRRGKEIHICWLRGDEGNPKGQMDKKWSMAMKAGSHRPFESSGIVGSASKSGPHQLWFVLWPSFKPTWGVPSSNTRSHSCCFFLGGLTKMQRCVAHLWYTTLRQTAQAALRSPPTTGASPAASGSSEGRWGFLWVRWTPNFINQPLY